MTNVLLLSFIFLLAGVVAVPIASRLGLGSVLGYLIAGIVISPILQLLDVNLVSIQHFAEFGVVMMLFLVGLELEPKSLWSMRAKLIGMGGGQVVLTTLAITGAGMVLGLEWQTSLAIGMVLCLSSTAIALQTLNEKGLMKSRGGQSSFSILLIQDIAIVPMLAIIPLLALPEFLGLLTDTNSQAVEHGTSLSLVDGLSSWQRATVTIGAIIAVGFAGSYLTGPVFRFIAKAKLRELFTATALMMIVGIALLMSLVGLSPALGTFLAGVILANSKYRHELESSIGPFKGLLLGVFFMSVGAGINFALLFDNVGTIIALTLGLMAIKLAILLFLAKLFKLKGTDKWLLGFGLAQAGEFGFVILSFTVTSGALPETIADKLLLVIALSMLLTPLLFIIYDRVITPRYTEESKRTADEITEKSQIIIAGLGRVGGLVNRMLQGAGYQATIIDYNSKQLEISARFGVKAYFGDPTRPDLLESAGIKEAKVLIIAIDNKKQITELARYAVENYPNLHVIARATDRNHVYDLWHAGCRDIIRESYYSSLRMGRSAFEAIGATRDQADRMSNLYDDFDKKGMLALAEHYDPDIPAHENEVYTAKVSEMVSEWEVDLTNQMHEILDETGLEPEKE